VKRPLICGAILVVDDSTDGREMLVEDLRFHGFTVHSAANGTEAVALAQKIRPQVVLTDLAMPGIDGLEATRRLKGDVRTRDAKILAVTARALSHEQQEAQLAGCDAFIAKPFDLTDLAQMIRRMLKRRKYGLTVPNRMMRTDYANSGMIFIINALKSIRL
jgi:two-component system, cell cycle response regulator DivK